MGNFITKQADRAKDILTQPKNFLRLLSAAAANRFHRLTHAMGPRRVKCGLCGWEGRHYDYFLERDHVSPGSQCPGCGSQTRNRELVKYLDRKLEMAQKWVLDIAPAPHYREWFEARGAKYISMDYGPRPARARMDMRRMAFRDEAFDLAVCSHVLEQIPDFETALRELNRVLKPGAAAVIDVPFTADPGNQFFLARKK